jgi:hypothetical protein
MLENIATLGKMHGVRGTMQKIREKFLPSASVGPSSASISGNGNDTGSSANWGTKTAGTVGPVDTAYQNIHDPMRKIRNKVSHC